MSEKMKMNDEQNQPSSTKNTDSSDVSEDDTGTDGKFMSEQTKYFEQVKQFLVSQQMALKQNLELLHNKMSKETTTSSHPKCINLNNHPHDHDLDRETPLLKSLELNSIENETGGGDPEESPTSSSSRKNIAKEERLPMCPICGIEFENNNLISSLEDHVASHWNSELLEESEEPP